MRSNERQLSVRVSHIKNDFPVSDTTNNLWQLGSEVLVETYWSGENASSERHFRSWLLWSDTALYVRFEADQAETLIISNTPDLSAKTKGLWERDVCEIFIAPDGRHGTTYFEFEIAPTGEWLDVALAITPTERVADWDFDSGMESSAAIHGERIIMAIKIPWRAFGKTPRRGEIWHGNLFRCVGAGPTRGYLAWQPTRTPEPNFHVPSAFGEFQFIR